jgi:hypothetical protein
MPKTPGQQATNPQLSGFVTEFQGVLEKLKSDDSKLFKTGIELIKFTAKVGDRVEFSIVIASKEAPKVDFASPEESGSVK